MKKLILLLLAFSFLTTTTHAQKAKKLLKVSSSTGVIAFEYNTDGKLSKYINEALDGGTVSETQTDTYVYEPNKIILNHYSSWASSSDVRTASLQNGRITSEVSVANVNEDEAHRYTTTLNYTYNTANELTEVTHTSSQDNSKESYLITWNEDVVNHIKMMKDGEPVGEINIEYDKTVDNPYLIALTNPLIHALVDEGYEPYAMLMGGYYGKPIKYAVKSIEYKEIKPNEFQWSSEDNYNLSYTKNAEGDVTHITLSGSEQNNITLTWEQVSSHIAKHTIHAQQPATYYNIDGMRQQGISKGLNIIKDADGKVRKIMSKQ